MAGFFDWSGAENNFKAVKSGYNTDMTGVERYPFIDGAQMRIELTLSMDKKETKRTVVTLLDWFTDLGAFMALLLWVAETCFSILEFDSLSNLLIRKLYFVQDKNKLGYG